MRIWDIPVEKLCRNHLLGEHLELHAIWSILTKNKKGYSRHPETLRWRGKLKALYLRHQAQVKEISARGWHHKSDLNVKLAKGKRIQNDFVDLPKEQIKILKSKKCQCII